jgi:hypothetical protein
MKCGRVSRPIGAWVTAIAMSCVFVRGTGPDPGSRTSGPGGYDPPRFSLCPDRPAQAWPRLDEVKRPLLAASEVVILNLGVWAVNRYINHADWAYISFESIRNNLALGFAYDSDPFFTNFFLHPYHGGLYFNTARSLGMNYWASSVYAFGGSLMWELFMENQRPSTNDLIMTTTGGMYGGEFLFRMSSLVLDDAATGARRVWREIVGLILNPWRGVNRLIFGDAWRTSPENRQIRDPLHGSVSFASHFVAGNTGLSGSRRSAGLALDLTYGEVYAASRARKPFDLIVLDSGLRFGQRRAYFYIDTYALLYGREHLASGGGRHLLGFFQNFDYLSNEEIQMGGSSFTAGLVSFFPFEGGSGFGFSAQLGAMVFGASNNKYTEIASRNYNYGLGPVAKAGVWLGHPAFGLLGLSFNHYEIYTLKGAAAEADESQDHLSVIKARYGLPLIWRLGLRAEYALFLRHTHFEGRPSFNEQLSRLGLSAYFGF